MIIDNKKTREMRGCFTPPLKRRAGLLYRLRKKGIRCLTRQRTIFYPYGRDPNEVLQIRRLREEYDFTVQFTI